jgi:hypothetical protein
MTCLRASLAPAFIAAGLVLGLVAALSPLDHKSASGPAAPRPGGTATDGRLTVALSIQPVRAAPGATVEFSLIMADRAANGALGYVVRFGDGSSTANPIPMYCLAGHGRPEHQTWRLSHRYVRAGTYHISAAGYANCSTGRITVTGRVVIT